MPSRALKWQKPTTQRPAAPTPKRPFPHGPRRTACPRDRAAELPGRSATPPGATGRNENYDNSPRGTMQEGGGELARLCRGALASRPAARESCCRRPVRPRRRPWVFGPDDTRLTSYLPPLEANSRRSGTWPAPGHPQAPTGHFGQSPLVAFRRGGTPPRLRSADPSGLRQAPSVGEESAMISRFLECGRPKPASVKGE